MPRRDLRILAEAAQSQQIRSLVLRSPVELGDPYYTYESQQITWAGAAGATVDLIVPRDGLYDVWTWGHVEAQPVTRIVTLELNRTVGGVGQALILDSFRISNGNVSLRNYLGRWDLNFDDRLRLTAQGGAVGDLGQARVAARVVLT